jgi:cytochrome P450
VFSVRLYQPKMDPVVNGPFMLARDNTVVNWRDRGIMQAMLSRDDLPAVRAMAGRIADESLDRNAKTGSIEVVSQLARYVPVRICGDYFGFPGPDQASMFRWSRATQFDMFKNLTNDPSVHASSVQAGTEMRSYLGALLKKKRSASARSQKPSEPEDIFTRLVRTHFPKGLGFDDQQLIANMAGLLIGSVETTSQAIVQVIEQLLRRPDVFATALQAAQTKNIAAFDAIVWEALRFNPINPGVFRLCEAAYTVAGGTPHETVIPAGAVVFAATASALFDASVVAKPEEFHADRPEFVRRHHFGHGHHDCLGRYVGEVEIPEIVRRVILRPGVRLMPSPNDGIDFQGGPFPEQFVIAYDE